MSEEDPTPELAATSGLPMRLLPLSRSSEWWEFKLVPALAIGYLTSLHLEMSAWDIVPQIGILILALIPGAVFVSVLNDWTDKADDAAADKENRQSGIRIILPISLLTVSLVAGGLMGWQWRENSALVWVYASGWVVYCLYSIPPVRLKKRGLAGVLCDASGANVVPALLAALLVMNAAGRETDVIWLAAVFCWSLCFGLRGILWHQIGDLEADRKSKTRTLVIRLGVERCMAWARWGIFPLEVLSMGVLITLSGWVAAALAIVSLAIYAEFVRARLDRFEMLVGLVKPRPRGIMVLQEYYDVLLPFSALLASAILEPFSLVVLLMHAVFFPVRWRQMLDDALKLRDPQYRSKSQDHA